MNATEHHIPSHEEVPTVSDDGAVRRLRPFAAWRAGVREFVLILASVLAALAAQAWWQQREDRAREHDYLRQLLADPKANSAKLQHAIALDSRSGVAAD